MLYITREYFRTEIKIKHCLCHWGTKKYKRDGCGERVRRPLTTMKIQYILQKAKKVLKQGERKRYNPLSITFFYLVPWFQLCLFPKQTRPRISVSALG